jgi:hypothetical protein
MGMNKNTILGWATLLMVVMGLLLIGLGAFRYRDISGWGFAAVGIGFLANAWVFSSLEREIVGHLYLIRLPFSNHPICLFSCTLFDVTDALLI